MKKLVLVIMSVVAAVNVVFCIKAFAADSDVVYDGDANQFVFLDDHSDLFGNFKTLYPGDEMIQEIRLKNHSEESIAIYLRAEPVQSRYRKFLELMTLSVYDSMGLKISSSNAADTAGLEENILIAQLQPDEEKTITAILGIDEKMGNEFQSTSGKIKWIFSAEQNENVPESSDTAESLQKSFDDAAAAESSEVNELPLTGDSTGTPMLIGSVVILVFSLIVIIAIQRKINDSD